MATHYAYSGPIDCTQEPNVNNVKDKMVIVTGGSHGIGAVYARTLVQAGAYVMIGDLDTKSGEALAGTLQEGRVFVSRCDVNSWDEQVKLFDEAISRSPTGRVDAVVVNAGIATTDGIFADDSEQDYPTKPSVRILDVNLIGGMYTIKLALYHFRRQYRRDLAAGKEASDTSLIIQSSMAGYLDMPGSLLYAASKFGLRAAMASLRHTTPQHRTRVNLIAPWFINTGMIPEHFMDLIASKGIAWASVQDAAGALIAIIANPLVNGRSFAVVPRKWAPRGYLDIDQDDLKEGDRLGEWQGLLLSLGDELANLN
ncbi:hypothetical protein H2204_006621 [Knufia peltigerae]|uniref:Uncharacterized protein n=1 Tax=Knufia peltigerae TaxID=1002370 RepID=A0AA38Y3D0_9EURO|nr:hypothetical protein H2204_006621 [Knufia peltigerae]